MFPNSFQAVVLIVLSVRLSHVEASKKWGRKIDKDGSGLEIDFNEGALSGPNLLVSKKLTADVFAVGWDLVVEYDICNVGKGRAFNVQVEDEDFTKINSRFDLKKGSPVMKVDFLDGGGAVVQFNITVVPNDLMKTGPFVFSPAKVTYSVHSNGVEEDAITGFSSISPPQLNGTAKFISREEADRKFKSKTAEYCIFFLMCVVPIGVPFSLWLQHWRKYNKLQEISQMLRAKKKMKLK